MDNAQDADRIEGGGRLFSISPAKRHITKHSGSVCDGGKVIGFNKSKKHQLRKLDALGEDNLSYKERWMGCGGSDGEDGLRPGNGSCKRYKSPKMFFDDCDTVSHASVPRKLRSAIRKRSSESISPPLVLPKKLKHAADGVELLRKDGLVKSNLKKAQAEVCIKDGTLGLISKDEEEVAEALYALAVMFPDTTKTDKKKMVGKQSGASSSALPKAENSISPHKETEIRKTKVEPKTIHYKDDKPICSSNVLDSATEVILPSPNGIKQPDISVGKQPSTESGCRIPDENLPSTVSVSVNERTIQRPCEFVVSSALTELSLEHGSKLLRPEKSLAGCNHPDIAFEPIGTGSSQPEVKCITRKNIDTGSSRWPGLSSRMSSDHDSAKNPAWFKSSTSSIESTISDSVMAKKDVQVVTNPKKSWKRCSTHVYISRFIKVTQMTDVRDRLHAQCSQIKTNEGQKQGPHDINNSPAGLRNGLIGSISTKGNGFSVPEKDATEVRNAILLHKRLVQDQQQGLQGSTKYAIHNARKQSLNFPSLPTGSRVETINRSNKRGQSPEALSPHPFLCLQSQYQPAVPYPVSQNYYSSTSFSGYPSSAAAVQQVHLPAFVGSMPPTVGASASTSSQPEQRQQQKLASLLMAHYQSGVASPNFPNWQSGLSDLSPMFHPAQIIFSPSRSSVEEIGSKYAPILQHQQQQQSVSATALLPPSIVKGQYHPSICEGNVRGTNPAYADNLQSAYLRCQDVRQL